MTNTPTEVDPVLYIIVCGSPAAEGVYQCISRVQAQGWQVCVVPTPIGARFLEQSRLEALTGFPVRTDYKQPHEPDILPPANAFAVAPATFNTVNKLASGITDTLATGLVCEGLGYGRPVLIVPWLNRALACHSAYSRSIKSLRADGAELILTRGMQPGGRPGPAQDEQFPWEQLISALDAHRSRA